jgi:hypothetical protein
MPAGMVKSEIKEGIAPSFFVTVFIGYKEAGASPLA